MFTKLILFAFSVLIIISFAAAQEKDEINIAKEYILNGEVDKAKDSYAKLAKKNENIKLIYADYLSILTKKDDLDDLNKFIKKSIKAFPDNVYYKIDYYLLRFENDVNTKSKDKEFDNLLKEISTHSEWYASAGAYLMNKKANNEALKVYLLGRKFFNNPFLFLDEVVQIYSYQGKSNELIEEVLAYVQANPSEIEKSENVFQQYLDNEEQYQYLEESVYKKIQKFPNDMVYNELLYWLYVQKKNFTRALIQARAIDKRKTNDGRKIIALGKVAVENKNYEDAIKIFMVVQNEQKKGEFYEFAIKNLIFCKEEILKNKYPIDKKEVLSLSNEYRSMVAQLSKNFQVVEPMRKWALLNAFYLNNRDTAIVLLQDAIRIASNDSYQRDLAKIDLADIYLLNDEPWESVLLYYQVEKTQKELPLGYEAKLKNAKSSYFKGEFQLAKEHLDVLKIATTREIANDALYMSLMIRDNQLEDSTGVALQSFSQIGLLLFQNKIEIAADSLNKMLKKYPNSSLTDDIYFEQAKIYRKLGQYDKAVNALKLILEDYPEEILGDDAVLLLANIYEQNIVNNAKAKEMYQLLITNYPSSIYADEARKKFRQLRGDKI